MKYKVDVVKVSFKMSLFVSSERDGSGTFPFSQRPKSAADMVLTDAHEGRINNRQQTAFKLCSRTRNTCYDWKTE